MHSFNLSKFFTLLLLLFFATEIAPQDISVTIPLDKPIIYADKKLYGEFITLNRSSTLQVNFTEIGANLSFIIFQVHSHNYNITLYKNENVRTNSANGTNLGLHSEGEAEMAVVNFFVKNSNDVDLKLYVAVHGYFSTDPLAGGCNLEFPVKVTPFLSAIHNRNYIYIDAAPPQFKDYNCLMNGTIDVSFYMVYLPQHNYDSDAYFEAIVDLMSLENIKSKRLIPRTNWYTRRMVSAYPGTGAVYVAVATRRDYNEGYSVYVPTTSYGCLPTKDDCELLEDSFSQFMCASLFFIGIFICYYGHRFFKTQTFIIGFLSGLVVTYIIVSMVKNNLDRPATLALSTFSGLCVGASRVVYWWIYGLPVFSIILSSADVGFLISSLVLYVLPDEWSEPLYLNVDLNFWTIFILIITLVTIALLTVNFIANLICCAVIGAYATILPIDYYLGSHMKYILINIERRATVPGYDKAVKMLTFQWNDWILAFLWLVLAVTGFLFQYHQNKGRPPFPPPPRSVRAVPELPVPVAGSYRRSLNNESDGARSLPYSYYTEKTPLLA